MVFHWFFNGFGAECCDRAAVGPSAVGVQGGAAECSPSPMGSEDWGLGWGGGDQWIASTRPEAQGLGGYYWNGCADPTRLPLSLLGTVY